MTNLKKLIIASTLPLIALAAPVQAQEQAAEHVAVSANVDSSVVRFNNVQLGEVNMFYREAGPKDAPVLLLLHGFPSSSHMYRNLIDELSDKYRVIAPDLPGFGSTKAPPRGEYDYTFDNLAASVQDFTDALKLDKYALFVFDYGAPVGFRLAAANPGEITAIITQNGNAYAEGLEPAIWDQIGAYWKTGADKERDALRGFLKAETTHFQYTHGVPKDRLGLISPDPIAHDQAILDRDNEIQLDLFKNYETNVALYPAWQEYFRTHQPPLLATWGKNDPFFGPAGAEAYKKDIPGAEVHLVDSGHFALESHGKEIAAIVREFLARKVPAK